MKILLEENFITDKKERRKNDFNLDIIIDSFISCLICKCKWFTGKYKHFYCFWNYYICIEYNILYSKYYLFYNNLKNMVRLYNQMGIVIATLPLQVIPNIGETVTIEQNVYTVVNIIHELKPFSVDYTHKIKEVKVICK